MSIQYTKLWEILDQKKMKKIQLQRKAGISGNILAKLGKNQYVSLETIEKICKTLDCSASDIIEFK